MTKRRTQSDKVLRDKAFEIASNPKYDGYQIGLASMVFKFFDKNTKRSGIKSISNQQLANELHKTITRKFKKRKVIIWGVDLTGMQLISKCDKGIRYLLCFIDLFTKYAWVIPLKDKKGVNAFQSILNSSKRNPNKTWLDQGSEFYNKSLKEWLHDNDMEMYSTHNEGKSVVAERFIKTSKNKIYKPTTAISKKFYFNVLMILLMSTIIHTIELSK